MKGTIIIGTAMSSLATLASAVQSDAFGLIVLRFIIGAGPRVHVHSGSEFDS